MFASDKRTSNGERDDISYGDQVRLLQEQLLQKDNDYGHHDDTNKTSNIPANTEGKFLEQSFHIYTNINLKYRTTQRSFTASEKSLAGKCLRFALPEAAKYLGAATYITSTDAPGTSPVYTTPIASVDPIIAAFNPTIITYIADMVTKHVQSIGQRRGGYPCGQKAVPSIGYSHLFTIFRSLILSYSMKPLIQINTLPTSCQDLGLQSTAHLAPRTHFYYIICAVFKGCCLHLVC